MPDILDLIRQNEHTADVREERWRQHDERRIDAIIANPAPPIRRITAYLREVGALYIPVHTDSGWAEYRLPMTVVTKTHALLLTIHRREIYAVPFYHFDEPLDSNDNDVRRKVLEGMFVSTRIASSVSESSPVNEQMSYLFRRFLPGKAYVGDGVYHRYEPTSESLFTWEVIDAETGTIRHLLDDRAEMMKECGHVI